MNRHRAERSRRTGRVRAVLGLGVLLALGTTGTYAHWTDDVTVHGTTLTSGTLDINVNGADPATTSLSMTAMVPGSSKAEVLPVTNVGTAPAKYTMTGGLTGAGATSYSGAGSNGLILTVRLDGTVSGGTCTGGTPLVNGVALTSNTATTLIGKRPSTALAPLTGNETLCFEIKLAGTAPSTLQGAGATAIFVVTATSDVS